MIQRPRHGGSAGGGRAAALSQRMGVERAAQVVLTLDDYYADQVGAGGRRVSTQAAKQLAEPRPGDLSEVDLSVYRELDARWHDWSAVADACARVALRALDLLLEEGEAP